MTLEELNQMIDACGSINSLLAEVAPESESLKIGHALLIDLHNERRKLMNCRDLGVVCEHSVN